MKTLDIIKSFLKIGTIGFGGGSALIPVVEKEVVQDKKYISEDEYTKNVVIANITPGALPVKLGALMGNKLSVSSAYSVAIPSVLMLILILTGFSLIGQSAIKYIEYASIGISTFIVLLLYMYINKVLNDGKTDGVGTHYIIITLIAFLLTFGKEIRQIISVLFNINTIPKPIFDIGTLDLMIITFFIICFIGNSKSKIKFASAIAVAFIYALCVGKMQVLQYGLIIKVVMLIMVAFSITYDIINNKAREKINIDLSPIKNIVIFILIPAVICILAVVFFSKNINLPQGTSIIGYIINVIISSVTSFGGGEAYVAVADGFFVQSGYIEPQVFYNQVVAIANALPGPILVKVAAAIGYIFGNNILGMGFGWLLSLVGMTLSIGVSSIGALIVLICFDALKNSPRLNMIKKYVLPVVCGMLLSTILSIVYEALKVMVHSVGINPFVGLFFMAVLLLIMLILHKKYHLNDVIILLLGGGLTLALFTLI